MISFLAARLGFTFCHRGNEYRCREHSSFVVKSDRISWYWHSRSVGGYGALDYLMKIEDYSFCGAMEVLQGAIPAPMIVAPESPEARTLILPERAKANNRLLAYLCGIRGIEYAIVASLVEKNMLYEDIRGNVIFVGCDPQGRVRFACLRGTYETPFKMDCTGSDKRYGFRLTGVGADRLYNFEAPIDALSHATLENIYTGDPSAWRRDSRLSLGGTSGLALEQYLQEHPATTELVFCLDSDDAGRGAAIALARKYAARGYWTRLELPTCKDYNEVLMARKGGHRE